MTSFDGAAFGKEIVAEVKRYLESATAPLMGRIDALEKKLEESTTTVVLQADFSKSIAELRGIIDAIPDAPELPDIPAIVADSIATAMRTFDEGLDSRVREVIPTNDALKAIVDGALIEAVPKAIGEVLSSVDQRIAAVTIERTAYVEMIDQAVSTVREEVAEQHTESVKSILELSSSLQEVTLGLTESISTVSKTVTQINEDAQSMIAGVDTEVAKRFDLLEAQVARLPVDAIKGEPGVGIEDVQMTDDGKLQIKLTGDQQYRDLGRIKGADGQNGLDGKDGQDGKDGEKGLDFDIDWAVGKISDEVHRAVGELPVPTAISIKSAHISDTGDLWIEIGDGGHTNLGKVKADEVDISYLEGVIAERVSTSVGELPVPKDGKDGIDGKDAVIDPSALKQLVFEEVAVQVQELPKPADGIGIKTAELDSEGHLILVLNTAEQIDVGSVIGANGKDVDPGFIAELVTAEVAKLPVPKNGKDGRGINEIKLHDNGRLNIRLTDGELLDLGVIKGEDGKDVSMAEVEELIKAEVATIPRPQDGKSVTVEEVTLVLAELVSKAVAEIPVPKDGVDGIGLAGAFIDRAGELVVTLTNGEAKQLGPVVGRDGVNVDMNVVAATIKQHVDSIPRPKDGLDGIGFDDMDVLYDEETKEIVISAAKGENVKHWKFFLPMVVDKGVFKEGTEYLRGDGATFGGSFWTAQVKTTDKPGTTDAWRLAVKKGRDGKSVTAEAKPVNAVKLGG